jgi:hypothetical protein
MKIEISGPACAFDSSGKQIIDPHALARIGLVKFGDEKCADYLDGRLHALGIEGGKLFVRFDPPSGMLRVITEYHVEKVLVEDDLAALTAFTKAQWSDGIGENGMESQGQLGNCHISVYPIPYDDELVRIVQRRKNIALFVWYLGKRILAFFRKLFVRNIDKTGRYGRTPLMQAILENNLSLTLDLLAKGANVNRRDEDNCTCLEFAATTGSIQTVLALLKAGVDVNQRGRDGTTAIMWAANRTHKDICEVLIENGADLNIVSENQSTVLSMASPARLDIVEMLLMRGANPCIPTQYGATASAGEFLQAELRRKSRRETDQEWANLCEAKAKLLQRYEANRAQV